MNVDSLSTQRGVIKDQCRHFLTQLQSHSIYLPALITRWLKAVPTGVDLHHFQPSLKEGLKKALKQRHRHGTQRDAYRTQKLVASATANCLLCFQKNCLRSFSHLQTFRASPLSPDKSKMNAAFILCVS